MKRSILNIIILIYMFSIVSFPASAQTDYENLLNSKEWQDMVSKGTVYLETGIYEKAMDYFQQVAIKYPYVSEAQYYLGFVYYKKGDYANAEKVFKRALVLDRANVPAIYYLGLIYYAKEEYVTAIEYFDSVTNLDPSFQSAYFNKGASYMKLQRPINGIREFAYSVYLEPTDENAFEALVHAYAKSKNPDEGRKLLALAIKKKEVSGGNIIEQKAEDTEKRADNSGQKKKNDYMEIFIMNPGEKRIVITDEMKEEELISQKGKYGIVEINFHKQADLRGKKIVFKVRGEDGEERLKVIIKDALTKSCPKFYVEGITTSWREMEINIERSTYMYLDTDKIKKIQLELFPPKGAKRKEKTTVFIKDIKIKE